MVASDLRLGGFSGAWGDESAEVKKKRRLLEEEGVRFDAVGRVRDECVHRGGEDTGRRTSLIYSRPVCVLPTRGAIPRLTIPSRV